MNQDSTEILFEQLQHTSLETLIHIIVESSWIRWYQGNFSLNLWGRYCWGFIGSVFLMLRLNGINSSALLHYLNNAIDDVPLKTRQSIWFLQMHTY